MQWLNLQVLAEWLNTSNIRNNVLIHESIVMPNHIHGIVEIIFQKGNTEVGAFQSPSQTLGAIVRGYKIATIKKIKEMILKGEGKGEDSKGELQFAPTAPTTAIIQSLDYKIWQRNYYEHIIKDENAYIHIAHYIENNPSNWKEVKLRKTD